MKTLLVSLILAALAFPFAACETSHTESTHKNWDGSVTHEETTVRDSPLGTSVDHSKTTSK